jgi:hypothetical protein
MNAIPMPKLPNGLAHSPDLSILVGEGNESKRERPTSGERTGSLPTRFPSRGADGIQRAPPVQPKAPHSRTSSGAWDYTTNGWCGPAKETYASETDSETERECTSRPRMGARPNCPD